MKQNSKDYAAALFSLACEHGEEELYLKKLEQVADLFQSCPQYLDLLETPTILKSERTALLAEAFEEDLPPYLLSFLQILIEKNEIRILFDCVEDYRSLYNQKAAILIASVTSARPLAQEEKEQLTAALQKRTGKTIRLVCRQDAALIGGIIVEADGVRYDGSLRHRLNEVKEVMQK